MRKVGYVLIDDGMPASQLAAGRQVRGKKGMHAPSIAEPCLAEDGEKLRVELTVVG